MGRVKPGTANDPARISADFAKAAKTGKITGAQATAIINRAKDDKLTESEAKTLTAEVARNRDSFSPEAKATFEGFINDKMKALEVLDPGPHVDPGPIKDPAVLKADKGKLAEVVVEGGEIFKNGITGKDPEQNYIGDCYLIASMSAIAKQSPQTIEKAFKKNSDGTYTVTLYDKKGSHFVPHPVTIDASLPQNDWYGFNYAHSQDPKELWPGLLEKAFAARAGSYGKIEAGVPGDAMAAITGKPSVDTDLRGKGVTADGVFAQLEAAMKAGKPATAATLSDSSAAKYKGTNIYTDHTYTVWGVSVEGGVKYVHLRNPWGNSEPANNGLDDGVFKLPLDQFMSLYSGISING